MRNLLLVMFAIVLVASVSMAQTNGSAEATYDVSISSTIQVTGVSSSIATVLSGGYTYTLDPANGSLEPDPTGNGGIVETPVEFDITTAGGVPAGNTTVTFLLPKALFGQALGGQLPVSFGPQSAWVTPGSLGSVGAPGFFANPNAPFTVPVGAAGCGIFLGITIQVPATAPDDLYLGTILCTASVTGI